MKKSHLFYDAETGDPGSGFYRTYRICDGKEIVDAAGNNLQDFWVHTFTHADLPAGYDVCDRCEALSSLHVLQGSLEEETC